MSYEDIIRVADLKTRASRFERVRRESARRTAEPVVVIDFLKPASRSRLSSAFGLGKKLLSWAERRGKLDAYKLRHAREEPRAFSAT
jgi:indolepyruvate ferredoxin oxidoreductase beta subunit